MTKKYVFFIAFFSILMLGETNTQATTVTFNVPTWVSLDGKSYGGFTFHGNWGNYGYPSSAPNIAPTILGDYSSTHYITFDAGTFTFTAMTLNGSPWDGYSTGNPGGTLRIVFMDDSDNIIGGYHDVPLYASWSTFEGNIPGVHKIYFYRTTMFWPRLGSITCEDQASSVPIPGAVWLLGSGLIGLWGLRRKFS